jgi:hypothetical protein
LAVRNNISKGNSVERMAVAAQQKYDDDDDDDDDNNNNNNNRIALNRLFLQDFALITYAC